MNRETAFLPQAPYRGIQAFRYVDAPIFFGREEDICKLIRTITIYRGVLLYGESGVGKSSLINAGLLPQACAEGFAPERLRVQPRAGEEIIVERVLKDPQAAAGYLPSLLAAEAGEASRVVLSLPAFREKLQALSRKSLAQYPLLIFDQFEEFITLFEEVSSNKEQAQKCRQIQQQLLTLIVELLLDASIRVKLVFSFREDYLAKLDKLFVRCPELLNQYVRLTPLRLKELPRIVSGPFEKFPGRFLPELSSDMAAQVIRAVEEHSDTDFINLTVVQVACLKLWSSPAPEEEFAQQGIQGLLEAYLSEAIDQLPAGQREVAILLLVQLVTQAGTRNVVSEADLYRAVREKQPVSIEEIKDILQSLEQQAKLIRREYRNGVHFYEIVSEFLIPWIRERQQEVAREEARREFEQQQSALRKQRRVRIAFLIAAISLVIAGLTGFLLVRNIQLSKNLQTQNRELELSLNYLQARQESQRRIMENAESLIDSLQAAVAGPAPASSPAPATDKPQAAPPRGSAGPGKNKAKNTLAEKQTRILDNFSNKVQNSAYTTTLVAYNISAETYNRINDFLREKGYSVNDANWNFPPEAFADNWPAWVAQESCIFYYDRKSFQKARQLARELEAFTRVRFKVRAGAGLGVLKGQEAFTFYIHLINRPAAGSR